VCDRGIFSLCFLSSFLFSSSFFENEKKKRGNTQRILLLLLLLQNSLTRAPRRHAGTQARRHAGTTASTTTTKKMSGIGMMDPAFFVGRNELVMWVNTLLKTKIQKVEQCASGAIYCQIMDAAHPNIVPMHKVSFAARAEHEYVQNYKVLQTVFDKLRIAKNIEVEKLCKARPLDNLEFLQWMKRYFDVTVGEATEGYDPVQRRMGCKGGGAQTSLSISTTTTSTSSSSVAVCSKKHQTTTTMAKRQQNQHHGRDIDSTITSTTTTKHSNQNSYDTLAHNNTRKNAEVAAAAAAAAAAAMREDLASLRLEVEKAEREREFYFEKLQDIEFICQRPEFENEVLAKCIEKILYLTEGKPSVEDIIIECGGKPIAAATKKSAGGGTATPVGDENTAPVTITSSRTASKAKTCPTPSSTSAASPLSAMNTPPPMFDVNVAAKLSAMKISESEGSK
jgi:RP/EB family microtubule-associated protein